MAVGVSPPRRDSITLFSSLLFSGHEVCGFTLTSSYFFMLLYHLL